MKTALLTRTKTGPTGTFGAFTFDGRQLVSMELPDKGNQSGVSCIPAGTYICKWLPSPKFGRDVYHLQNVPGRTVVEIHPANWAGDKALGLKCELEGCVALGGLHAEVEGQEGISGSRKAVAELEGYMGGEDFEITIVDNYLEAGETEGARA